MTLAGRRTSAQEEVQAPPRPVRNPVRRLFRSEVGRAQVTLPEALPQAPRNPAPIPVRRRLRPELFLSLSSQRLRPGQMVFADRRRGHSSQHEQERENKRDVLRRMPAVATGESDLEHCLESYTPAGQGQ